MAYQTLAILGSTGSIGKQALEIVKDLPDSFKIAVLSAHSNWKLLAEQILEFRPSVAVVTGKEAFEKLKGMRLNTSTTILFGSDALARSIIEDEVDVVLNALVGFAGFKFTCIALQKGIKVALANKESLVAGGELIMPFIQDNPGLLIPVDSEHSAMLQCLVGEQPESIERVIITASGGPFKDYNPEQMKRVSVEQALKHPNWNMGAKITIDSSTLMNKGFEIIEAHWLFGLDSSKIIPVIHPQSIIHSMVTFVDGSTKAQLGPPDMKVPILYALTYPERRGLHTPRMDWAGSIEMTFKPVNYQQFPCVRFAFNCIEAGGISGAVLNAANEIAVQKFLNKEIGYIHIAETVDACLQHFGNEAIENIEHIHEIDSRVRSFASTLQ